MRNENPLRRDRPVHGAAKEWRFFQTAAGPDETEYPADEPDVNVYYARELRNVSFKREVGAQTLTYEETERFNYICNLEPEKYIEEGSIVLGFLENGRWWTIDKVVTSGFHLFDRVTWSPGGGMKVVKTLLPSAEPSGGWGVGGGVARSLARSDEHVFGAYSRWQSGIDPPAGPTEVPLRGVGLVKATPSLSEVWARDFDDIFPGSAPGLPEQMASVAAAPDGVSCVAAEVVDVSNTGPGPPMTLSRWAVCDPEGVVLGHGALEHVGSTNGVARTGGSPSVVCDGEKFYILDALWIWRVGWQIQPAIVTAVTEIGADGALENRTLLPRNMGAIDARWNPATGEIVYTAEISDGRVIPGVMLATPGEWDARQVLPSGHAFGRRRTEAIDVGQGGTIYMVESEGRYDSGGIAWSWNPDGPARLKALTPDAQSVIWSAEIGPAAMFGDFSLVRPRIAVTPDGSKIYMAANPDPEEGQGYAVFNATDGTRLGTHDFERSQDPRRAARPSCVVASNDQAWFGHEYAR